MGPSFSGAQETRPSEGEVEPPPEEGQKTRLFQGEAEPMSCSHVCEARLNCEARSFGSTLSGLQPGVGVNPAAHEPESSRSLGSTLSGLQPEVEANPAIRRASVRDLLPQPSQENNLMFMQSMAAGLRSRGIREK